MSAREDQIEARRYVEIALSVIAREGGDIRVKRGLDAALAVFETAQKPTDDFPHGHPELDAPTDDEREALGWSEAEAYADDKEPSKRVETADDFMAGWRTADRLRRPASAEGNLRPKHLINTLRRASRGLKTLSYESSVANAAALMNRAADFLDRHQFPEPTNAEREKLDAVIEDSIERWGDEYPTPQVAAYVAADVRAAGFRLPESSELIECPHWSPGKITLRKGCTACEAERQARAGWTIKDGVRLDPNRPEPIFPGESPVFSDARAKELDTSPERVKNEPDFSHEDTE